MRSILIGIIFLCGALAMNSTQSGTASAAEASEPRVLRHIVMYKFKPEVTAVQLQEVIDTFAGLAKKVPTVKSLEHGTNVSKEGKSDGLTHVFVVTFANEKDLQTYIDHPEHKKYVDVVKDRREKVVVFDFWTGEEKPAKN